MRKPRYRCSDCEHWHGEGSWHSTHFPNFGVISEGRCDVSGQPRLNCYYQCRNDFKLADKRGVITILDANDFYGN